MTFSDQVRPVPPLDDGVIRILGISSPALTYPRSPRGQYLRCLREALGLTVNSAHKVLDIGLAAYTGLERGSCVFTDRATWARAELVLIAAAGPGWSGERADGWIRLALMYRTPTGNDSAANVKRWFIIDAAAVQIHTVKRGVLYRLAADFALAAEETDEAARLAYAGLTGDTIGPRPEWLETALQMLISDAVKTRPVVVEAVS